MRKQSKMTRALCAAMAVAALASLGVAGSASAKLVKEFTRFEQCPYTDVTAFKCIYGTTESGEVVLGSKKVPIVNPVTIQAGYTKAVEGFSKFIAAKNGVTLSKAAQPVPGGLLGLIPPEGSPPLVKELVKLFFENGFTGVNSTLELARPASEVLISENNLTEKEGLALKLPVKFHLENPLLGNNCYVGSSGSPVYWELTAGTTNPPKPNEPITGNTGLIELLEGGRILRLSENILVDNAWAAPGASGCGGFPLELLINPVINTASGLPAAKGLNTAILNNTNYLANASAVKKNDLENP